MHHLASFFVPVLFKMTVSHAQQIGAQCPLELYVVRVQLPPPVLAKVQMYDRTVSNGLKREHYMSLWPKKGMWREIRAMNNRKSLLSFADEKIQALVQIAKANPNKRILVFGGSIAAINWLAEILQKQGIAARAYHSKLSIEDEESVSANEFASWGKDYNVLLAVQKLDEGVDVPDAKIAVMLASGKGDLQMIQRTGRIMRPSASNEPAQLYLVIAAETSEESLRYQTIRALELSKDHVHSLTLNDIK
jgi:superfamily II DNA or RNA helicase